MQVGVYYIASNNVTNKAINTQNYAIIEELGAKSGLDMIVSPLEKLHEFDFNCVFIGGGGTEGMFLDVFSKLPKPIILLTSGENNSLAASMEILSFLQQHDQKGEIIHGKIDQMATRLQRLAKVFAVKRKMANLRLGRVGKASDWLIASDVDAKISKEVNGIELIDISMDEFFSEIDQGSYEENEYTKTLKNKKYDEKTLEKALDIYGALKRICLKYQLDGVTVRCFDLLEPVKNTGCIALAILNAEGVYAGCEGDVPALISMCVLGELSGRPIFMANPSRINDVDNEIVFAHCTIPINMPSAFRCMTHFESGLGVAIAGDLPLGKVTVFKTSGLLDRYFVTTGELVENLHEQHLCRTQIRLKVGAEDLRYMLTSSIGNHHMICLGDYKDLIDEYFKW
ncbi:MAG: hypothetical protein PHG99_00680 [Erysipelotrichaceae bacterium]|nr:hypothetical protein [Erysipelotrichaceae bacterium]MDD4642006.1 hypothetical protein [Erysipelotrichaceae bacterium]